MRLVQIEQCSFARFFALRDLSRPTTTTDSPLPIASFIMVFSSCFLVVKYSAYEGLHPLRGNSAGFQGAAALWRGVGCPHFSLSSPPEGWRTADETHAS